MGDQTDRHRSESNRQLHRQPRGLTDVDIWTEADRGRCGRKLGQRQTYRQWQTGGQSARQQVKSEDSGAERDRRASRQTDPQTAEQSVVREDISADSKVDG